LILEIVTTEETIYSGEADIVIAPGVEGQLGILPRHAPLLTAVANGVVVARKGTAEETIPVTGGFLEVVNDKVTILA
jgi:F-type H+-transporting ATPase subunit epsilon|tara:strand:+ start:389 stop:619 length:231 start_codon:yes stop_codon:yes gene_type:complete